ncbi:GPW/gp25 family protein [uncultured Roseobacter sp.]|uniref:GPW/gp25 family protein n=1 Tax=uncultured Roseobacter sp. TaxID=114847 RepID=UPI002633C83A|nr:GPW/gp25 family protein [uncultured Roseobacter sp.]
MTDNGPAFLGTGWGFPPSFDVPLNPDGSANGPGAVVAVAGDHDIHESLRILFATLRGERLAAPDYGVGLHQHVLGPMDESDLGELRSQIEDAIVFFEPRIKLRSVEVTEPDAPGGLLEIHIDYDIPSINSRGNMVYPLYFEEGNNIPEPSTAVRP